MEILTEHRNGVMQITLNRPEVYNSINRTMALQMQASLNEAAANESVRAVVITGSGKAFCAGQDLAEAIDPEGPGLERILAEHYNPIIQQIVALPKPVVALVNGVAAGAGANIALACDVVIAHEQASFIQAFSKIGLIPDSGGTYFLPRLIGAQKALALMMTGDKVTAAEGIQMGMVYKVWPDAEFTAASHDFAVKMAAMPTTGLALTKKALNSSYTNTLEQQLALEDTLQFRAGNTADYAEGTRAFLEKRSALFIGK